MEVFLAFAYWLVFAILAGGVLAGALAGIYYLVRLGADKRPDWFLGLLLLAITGTLLHNLFIHLSLFDRHPGWRFLPIYFTLSFGPFLFFFIKFRLFPKYHFRWTDLKHLILPAGQFIYFTFLFLQPVDFQSQFGGYRGRHFLSPFYGGVEMLLYIGTFFSYHLFGYRYIKFKKAVTRKTAHSTEGLEVAWLKRMVKALFLLFLLNASYILADFFTFELFGLNLHLLRGFDYLGSLSLASMLYWLAFNAWVMRRL